MSDQGVPENEMFAGDIAEGNRVYRTIMVDKTGKMTLSSYDAVKIVFDNRLEPGEIRRETYHFKIPENSKGRIFLSASLKYLPYPGVFARRLGQPEARPVEIASTNMEIDLKRAE